MKKPIFEIRNLIFKKNNLNILSIKKFEVHRSALYLFNGNMASGKTLLLDILSKKPKIGFPMGVLSIHIANNP